MELDSDIALVKRARDGDYALSDLASLRAGTFKPRPIPEPLYRRLKALEARD